MSCSIVDIFIAYLDFRYKKCIFIIFFIHPPIKNLIFVFFKGHPPKFYRYYAFNFRIQVTILLNNKFKVYTLFFIYRKKLIKAHLISIPNIFFFAHLIDAHHQNQSMRLRYMCEKLMKKLTNKVYKSKLVLCLCLYVWRVV